MYQSLRASLRLSMRGLVFAGGVCIMSYWLTRCLHSVIMRRRMTERRNRKREEKARAKKQFAAYLKKNPMPVEEIEQITAKPFMDLVESLKQGKLTPQKVLLAYQHKAFEVDQRCNCVIEFLYPDFSEINLKGPFAGAPISLKDMFYVKGCESYAGMAYYLTGPAQTDSVLVTTLKSLGAVPFVRTNVPQSLLSVLSVNPIDGDTLNPLALDRSPGGSSSGEAALIAGGGSGLGIGTDLGGSIRLPAALCNIVGFKPTPQRLSKLRMLDLRINSTIPIACGPLARDVKTCVAIMQSLCDSPLHHELDYFIPPLPFFTEFPKKQRLRIGYFISNDFVTPVPAAQRAVLHVKSKLEALGHEVIPWQPPCPGSVWFLIYVAGALYFESAGMAEALRFDATEPSLQARLKLYHSSWIVRWFYWLFGEKIASFEELTFLRAYWTGQSVPALVEHLNELAEFRLRMYDHWRESNLDGVICPAFGMAAPPPVRTVRKFSGMLSFLNLFNVCGMPAGCLPSGIHVEERDLAPLKASLSAKHKHISHSQTEVPDVYPVNSEWEKTARDLQLSSLGFPVSVQVATAPWRDELCLRIMQEIESAVRNPGA